MMTGKCIIQSARSIDGIVPLLEGEREIYIIHDTNVEWVARDIASALGGVRGMISLETSEEMKVMGTVLEIERRLMEAGASRGALVLAVGGGITTDLAGFAASMYKRGVRYANVPTTLLAQVDAAIGGKTGVNLDGYKNMIGAFHMPQFTFIYPTAVETLPPEEKRCGLAEMLKTFLIGDADAYRKIALGSAPEEFVARAAHIKADIVERDPLEKGERAVLNLGHTFGHAIEHCSGGEIPHGEAVGMGIILAAKLSEGLGVASKGMAAQLAEDFRRLGLETECPYGMEQLYQAMKKDKKDGKFVLLREPGKPVIMTVTEDDLYKYTK